MRIRVDIRPVIKLSPVWVLLASFGLASHISAQVVTPEVKKVSEAFVCQCGCNHQLSACAMLQCPSATPLRQEISTRLKQGMNQKQIIDAFVKEHGRVILSAPTTRGLDLAAWILPFAMLVVGFIIVYMVIRAWLRRPSASTAGAVGRVSIPEEYQKKIERELKEFDS